MRKRVFFILLFFVVTSAGCATVQKKFTRKKKEPKHVAAAVYYTQEPYQKKYSNEYYYKTHYTFWKSWQGDVVSMLGGNQKKLERCVTEAYGHLDQMGLYLKEDKRSALLPELEALKAVMDKILSGQYSQSDQLGMRQELERIKRSVANNFYFDKVKDSVLPDDVKLGA